MLKVDFHLITLVSGNVKVVNWENELAESSNRQSHLQKEGKSATQANWSQRHVSVYTHPTKFHICYEVSLSHYDTDLLSK